MTKIFISLPMHGRTIEDIKEDQNRILNSIKNIIEDDSIELIETAVDGTGMHRLECLGRSIAKMAQADYIYFANGWKESKGCIIEHECAIIYGLNIIAD